MIKVWGPRSALAAQRASPTEIRNTVVPTTAVRLVLNTVTVQVSIG